LETFLELNQAIEPSALHCGRVVHRPSIGAATDNGDALGLPGSPSRPLSIQDEVLMPTSETA
jgi:hypothetical protein